MAKYELIYAPIRVGKTSLTRQDRVDLSPHFHCVSWRQQREGSQSNRRYYIEKDRCWSLPVADVLQMLRHAKDTGFFRATEIDPGTISISKVVAPGDPKYFELIGQVLEERHHEQEWRNSSAVICTQACGKWRKVMLVSKDAERVTFRSLTLDCGYKLAHKKATAGGWRLDRAMVDAHPTAFVHWLKYLEMIV
jgi:hypothetical protein